MDKFGFSKGRANPYAQSPQVGFHNNPSTSAQHSGSHIFMVDNAPDPSYVNLNHAAVPPGSFNDGQYIIIDGKYVMTAR